jgi:hypothetical protein
LKKNIGIYLSLILILAISSDGNGFDSAERSNRRAPTQTESAEPPPEENTNLLPFALSNKKGGSRVIQKIFIPKLRGH